MKRQILYFLTIAVAALTVSCDPSNEFKGYDNVSFKINYPEGFASDAVYSGPATLLDRNSGQSYSATADAAGVVTFNGVLQGSYNLTVSQTLGNAEFRELAPELAGDLKSDIMLSGNLLQINLFSDADAAETREVNLVWTVKSDIVFSKIYGNGTKTTSGSTFINDRYWELFNNSNETVYLDGLCFGYIEGNTMTGAVTNPFYEQYKDALFASAVIRFPGSGTEHPLAPGESVVVAQNAQNYITEERPLSVDLTGADFEAHYPDSDMSTDNPDVTNMEVAYKAIAGARVFGTTNGSYIMFRASAAEIEQMDKVTSPDGGSIAYLRVPNEMIMDAVQQFLVEDANRVIHEELDASFVLLGRSTPLIAERKISHTEADGRIVLQDTNSSSQDFLVTFYTEGATADYLQPRQYDKPELMQ